MTIIDHVSDVNANLSTSLTVLNHYSTSLGDGKASKVDGGERQVVVTKSVMGVYDWLSEDK